jgi:hypothetical protein
MRQFLGTPSHLATRLPIRLKLSFDLVADMGIATAAE